MSSTHPSIDTRNGHVPSPPLASFRSQSFFLHCRWNADGITELCPDA